MNYHTLQFDCERVNAVAPARCISLKARNVEHQEGYVAVFLLVAANPVTWPQVERVVTRHR